VEFIDTHAHTLGGPDQSVSMFQRDKMHDGGTQSGAILYRPTFSLLTIFVLTIFFAELAVMLVVVDHVSPMKAALVDSTLISAILLPALYLLVLRPVSANVDRHIRAERSLLTLERILDRSANEIYLFDALTLRFLGASKSARSKLGYTMAELALITPPELMPELTSEQFKEITQSFLIGEKEEITFETTCRRKDESTYPVEVCLQLSGMETPPILIAIILDISERKRYSLEIEKTALFDTLTSLPNRVLLQDRLQLALKVARRETTSVAVLIADVVRLRDINGIMGHKDGDIVLQEIAKRLKKGLRESDTIARLGGDEFAIVLPAASLEGASLAAEKIQGMLEQPIVVHDIPLEIEVAIGIALYPDHGDTPATLLQHADSAMQLTKNDKRRFAIYNPRDDISSLKQLRLFGEIRQAINDNTLTLYYQPKVDIKRGIATSVEALARWPHLTEGIISPSQFIPLVEQSGLIRPFTLWALNRAVEQCHYWGEAGIDLNIAVNLSTRNLLDPGLPDNIASLLGTHGINAKLLTIEITESAMMSRSESALRVLSHLHDMGLRISIDDFGTGYSSLAYLTQLPVDELKIDQSFVSNMSKSSTDEAIVRSTIDLAHNLGLSVVAEGVETKEIRDHLEMLGCDVGQGYFFSCPLSSDELSRWLADWRVDAAPRSCAQS
jgi:diguanylate cyclase (GGDEF)-like protein/PAS domain S-box-containing protein